MGINRPVITMGDYERIFRVVHSVYQDIDQSNSISCQFYNVAGAFILNNMYKKKATPVMGAAFFKLHDPSETTLYFGHMDDNVCSSSVDAFHCWIQAEGYLIDFTAPLYREYLKKTELECPVPRRMFQKKLAFMSSSHHELQQEGDFYVQPNVELTRTQLIKGLEQPLVSDALTICLHWFKKPPKKIEEKLRTMNQHGETVIINLSEMKLSGAW